MHWHEGAQDFEHLPGRDGIKQEFGKAAIKREAKSPKKYWHEGAQDFEHLPGRDGIKQEFGKAAIKREAKSPKKFILYYSICFFEMSPARQLLFCAAVLFDILVVIAFLWIVPCDISPCEGNEFLNDRDWDKLLSGIGIDGMYLVHRRSEGRNVLLKYYTSFDKANSTNETEQKIQGSNHQDDDSMNNFSRTNRSGLNATQIDDKKIDTFIISNVPGSCGLTMLDGLTGLLRWSLTFPECPIAWVNCDMIDVNGDDIKECLVLGNNKVAAMVDPQAGKTLWYLHMTDELHWLGTSEDAFYDLCCAFLVDDVDVDGVQELTFLGRSPYGMSTNSNTTDVDTRNKFIIASGKTGIVIHTPVVMVNCLDIYDLLDLQDVIIVKCVDSHGTNLTGVFDHYQIRFIFTYSVFLPAFVMYVVDSNHLEELYQEKKMCQVVVNNEGSCPDCMAKVMLVTDKGISLFEEVYNQSIVISNVALIHENVCQGAQLKVWHWEKVDNIDPIVGNCGEHNHSSGHCKLQLRHFIEKIVLIKVKDENFQEEAYLEKKIKELCHDTECAPSPESLKYSILAWRDVLDREWHICIASPTFKRFGSSPKEWQLSSHVTKKDFKL
ncbi:uncharacterized protein LOC143036977 [Oratosquilla oratoria]|uniref:uncharacterized protein LOC143036977 n=1 Tax=Oratosquilla oratoria TaxID=337810 RepID=UPI003F75DD06